MSFYSVLSLCFFIHIIFLTSVTKTEFSRPDINNFEDNNKPFRVCVLEKRNNIYDNPRSKCSIFKKFNAPVRCVIAVDRLDCLRKVSMKQADFAVFEGEELLVASTHKNLDNLLVVSEFQYTYSTFNKFQYSLTAVVRNDVNINSIEDLEGKRLCHPGTDPDGKDHSDIFTQFFEDRIVAQRCDINRTVVENRIKSLSDYFGPSCRAGPWTLDTILDSALKKKYNNLCSICDNNNPCSIHNQYWGHQNSLLCLSDCEGEFAWGRVHEIKRHFKPNQYNSKYQLCNNVSFLCPDGTLQDLNTPEPCVWIQKPNTAIAAHSSIAIRVQDFIERVLINQTEGKEFRTVLWTLLEFPPRFVNIDLTTPTDYLRSAEGFLSSTSVTKCGRDRIIKLCASSNHEKAQCEWLSAAAGSYGIEPPISCYEPADFNCFAAVLNHDADVFLTNSDLLLPGVRDYKLMPLLYETVADKRNSKYFSILVDTYAKINKLEDLKGKRACFTTVDGVGWTSLIIELQKASLLPNICPYTAAISSFFDKICLTGQFNSSITQKYKNIKYCNSELSDDYNKQSGIEKEVVECILNGGGDVAFVAVDAVSRYSEIADLLPPNYIGGRYKWLCGSSGLKDKPCLLTGTTMGQVLVNEDISYIRKEDIVSTFKSLDALFGGANRKGRLSFTFDMLSEFESSSEIFFQDLGDRLELSDIYLERNKLENSSYENEIRYLKPCHRNCSTNTVISIYHIVFLCIFYIAYR